MIIISISVVVIVDDEDVLVVVIRTEQNFINTTSGHVKVAHYTVISCLFGE